MLFAILAAQKDLLILPARSMSFLEMIREEGCVYFPSHLRSVTDEMASQYARATPFPHAVIDDFLPVEILNEVAERFPSQDTESDFNRSVERGKASFNPDRLSSGLHRSLFYSFNSRPFLEFLEQLSGINGLIPDPYFLGGGYHRTSTGGHLSVHADFNLHEKLRLRRRINVLIYLNKDWNEQFGGNLELWETDMSARVRSIEPLFNRCVIFNTDDTSYHGHPDPLATPRNVARRSIALYYYTASDAVFSEFTSRTTKFRERAGTGDRLGFKVRLLYFLNDLMPPVIMRGLLRLIRGHSK